MKGFLKIEVRLLSLIALLLIGSVTYFYFLFKELDAGFIIACLSLVLIIATLFFGTVLGLFGSLITIFIVGSIVLFLTFTNSTAIEISIPLIHLFFYGVSMVILILFSGSIHNYVEQKSKELQQLQFEIEQFVAIDPATGFDNKTRMIYEVQSEMNRVNRYGGAFTFILLQLDYIEEFEKLYGNKEKKYLMEILAKKIDETMRSTDRKFRYAPNKLALLLTNTDDESVDVIYQKIIASIRNHQLLSGKYVSLTFHGSHVVYKKERGINNFEQLFHQVESELMMHAL